MKLLKKRQLMSKVEHYCLPISSQCFLFIPPDNIRKPYTPQMFPDVYICFLRGIKREPYEDMGSSYNAEV